MATPIPTNQAEFSLEQVLASTQGRLLPVPFAQPSTLVGVASDSRENLSGKIFVALKGELFDGHRFLTEACASGAELLLVEERALEPGGEVARWIADTLAAAISVPAMVAVTDTLVALGDLALHYRRRWSGTLIAVAGSAGKTTTRSTIQALFSSLYPGRVHGTRGNLNNRIGVPMTLFGLEPDHEWAVIEIGTNCPGEISELARIAEPQVGVLTLIDLEHTEGLGDLDGVELEEGALFAALPHEGLAVGYLEDERVRRQLLSCSATKRGYFEDAAVLPKAELLHLESELLSILKIEERSLKTPKQSRLNFSVNGQKLLELETHLLGKPGALAISAALSVALHYCPTALQSEKVQTALVEVGEPGRSVPHALADNRWVIDDTYNSNPASVCLSVDSGRKIAAHTGGQLWLVLGEMLELGACSATEHAQMGQLAAESGAAGLFAVGGDAEYAQKSAAASGLPAYFFSDAALVGPALLPRLLPGDVILVKASRGVRAERVVNHLLAQLPPSENS